jgi:hypothetical protein
LAAGGVNRAPAGSTRSIAPLEREGERAGGRGVVSGRASRKMGGIAEIEVVAMGLVRYSHRSISTMGCQAMLCVEPKM